MTLKQWLKELPLDPAVDFLEHRISPIFVKEIRLVLREKFFVSSHLIALGVMGIYALGALLTAYVRHKDGGRVDNSEMGATMYWVLQIMQTFSIVGILPGVTATLISAERESGTFEMLLCASMNPLKILWGKTLSALAITFMITVSVLPLSLAAPIVGGVELGHVFRWYLTLGVLAFLMAGFSLCISSLARSAAHAIIGSYAAAVNVIVGIVFLADVLQAWGVYDYSATMFGFVRMDYLFPGVFSGTSKEFLLGFLFPLGLSVLLTAILFASALYSITPPHPSRTIPMKTLCLVGIVTALILCAICCNFQISGTVMDIRAAQGLAILLAIVALFASDDLALELESSARGPLRPFYSGAENGLFFTWIITIVAAGCFALLFGGRSLEVAAGLAGWGFFCSGLAFLLRMMLPSARVARMLYMGIVFLLIVVPVILDAIVTLTASPRDFNPLALVTPLLYTDLTLRYRLDWDHYFPIATFLVGFLCLLAAKPMVSRLRTEPAENPDLA
jgi:ABC-type transport system involved in multi-copper enzyme maturation permease subunit